MADNAVIRFQAELDKLALVSEQKTEVVSLSDTLWRESWAYHCDHLVKHLDAIALANPLNREIQERVTLLKDIAAKMKAEGMPEITAIEAV